MLGNELASGLEHPKPIETGVVNTATEPGPESCSRLGSQVLRLHARYPTRNDVNEPENATSFR